MKMEKKGNGFNFPFVSAISLLFLLLASAGALTVPVNIVAYVPITFTNYQNAGITANTPLAVGTAASGNVIGINALQFQQYETCNLNNAEFFLANGIVINSWLEGNALNESTVNALCTSDSSPNALADSSNIIYWVEYPWPSSFLPANTGVPTTNVIYLGWAGNVNSTSNTLFSSITGEAPQLSRVYAYYDNGANVFSYYNDFAGNSLSADGWSNSSFYGGTTSNGVSLRNLNGLGQAGIYIPFTYSLPFVIDADAKMTQDQSYGISLQQNAPQIGGVVLGNFIQNGYTALWNFNGANGIELYKVSSNTATAISSSSYPIRYGQSYATSISWSSGALMHLTDYGNDISASDSTFSSESYLSLYVAYSSTWSVQWVRARSYPPNGILPATTSGSAQPANPIALYAPSANHASVSDQSSNQIYICEIGVAGSSISSQSWNVVTSSAYSSIGFQTTSACSATYSPATSAMMGAFGVNVPVTTNVIYADSAGSSGNPPQLTYEVSNTASTVVIAIAAAAAGGIRSVTLPSGCTQELLQNDSSYDGVYFALCTNQAIGIYNVSMSVDNGQQPVSMAAIVYETPGQPINPAYSFSYSTTPSVTALSGNQIYVCAIGGSDWQHNFFTSQSWNVATNSLATSIGTQTNDICSATVASQYDSDIGVFGVNTPTMTNTVYADSISDLQNVGQLSYTVTNSESTVVIAIATGYATGISSSVTIPGGCTQELQQTDNFHDSVYFALCTNQAVGTYNVFFSPYVTGYPVSMAAFVYETPGALPDPAYNLSIASTISVTAAPGNQLYVCALGGHYYPSNMFVSQSWNVITSSLDSMIGLQTGNVCSATVVGGIDTDSGAFGFNVPTMTNTVYAGSNSEAPGPSQLSYTVSDSVSTVVIAIATGYATGISGSVTIPSGCTEELQQADSSYDDVYFALCTNQATGSYTVSFYPVYTNYPDSMAAFVFNGPPLAATLTTAPGAPSNVDIGSSITFNAVASGGHPPYMYTFNVYNSVTHTTINSFTTTANSFSFTTNSNLVGDTLNANVVVTDTYGYKANSILTAALTVSQLPSINIIPSTTAVTAGQTVIFTNNTIGGATPYTYNYFVTPSAGAMISGNSITFTAAGAYTVSEQVTDADNAVALSNNVMITVSSSGGGGVRQGATQTVTLNDNLGRQETNSDNAIIRAYVAGSGSVAMYSYWQNQLPVTITVPESDYLNFSFACSFALNGTTYDYGSSVYGLGSGYPCNSNYTIYGSEDYEVIYNKVVQTIPPVNTTTPPPPIVTNSINATKPTQNTTINTTNTIKPVTISANLTIPPASSLNFTTYLDTGNGIYATLVVTNTTSTSPSAPRNETKLESFSVYSQTQFQNLSITINYGCRYPANDVAPYYYVNGTWKMIQDYKVNQQNCTITFVSLPSSEYAIFSSTNSSAQHPAEASTPSGESFDTVYVALGIAAIVAVLVLIYLILVRRS